jgi:hypothetical protein
VTRRGGGEVAVAEEVHILDVHAELLPTDKAKIVSEIPGRVAFVGDGVKMTLPRPGSFACRIGDRRYRD